MEFVADLHLHSKYSRAVSQDMVLPIMDVWAKKKGLDIITTGDWTHPLWLREIKSQLEETSEGLFTLKTKSSSSVGGSPASPRGESSPPRQTRSRESKPPPSQSSTSTLFLLSTEISSIYSQGGKLRRIHNLVLSPSFETCEKINQELLKRGCNLSSDGRPIIGLSSRQLLELILSIDKSALLIPCHAWTPWFSLYGSNSGFDSIEECFEDYSKYIYAVETGLSSDPEMNWRIKELENRAIVSFSDSHSPPKMGREATVFVENKNGISNIKYPIQQVQGKQISNKQISYSDITSAIKRNKDGWLKIGYTIEFYPEEGKYHYTGHRNCRVVQSPQESKEKGIICPICKRPLTVGVMHRVSQLADSSSKFQPKADRPLDDKTQNYKIGMSGIKWIIDPSGKHPPFVKLVPLNEIIAEGLSSTVSSIKVKDMFDDLCSEFGSELNILLKTPIEEIEKVNPKIAEGLAKVRKGEIVVDPGFDGEYGKVKIWPEGKISKTQEEETQSIFEEEKSKEDDSQLSIDF